MKSSLIITVLNEEKSLRLFLDSIQYQSIFPNEVIIIDGGSTDKTLITIDDFICQHDSRFSIKTGVKEGNRSVGRNEAIKRASGDIILITDAGCILDKDWVKNISDPFNDKKIEVVAGYYAAKADTVFQKCLVPYVLVMPDKVNPKDFLPATRSMALRKSVWEELGGFDERYSHNEDYVFARMIRDTGKKMVFAKDAIVYWVPRQSFREAFVMFYRFAYGDGESGIVRPKVILLFFRYLTVGSLLLIDLFLRSNWLSEIILFLALAYIFWSIQKNYRYIKERKAFYYLPLIQFIADLAVIKGSLEGFLVRRH